MVTFSCAVHHSTDRVPSKGSLGQGRLDSRNPAKVALAYTADIRLRNRAQFLNGRDQIEAFLARKWNRELSYRLIKEGWAFAGGTDTGGHDQIGPALLDGGLQIVLANHEEAPFAVHVLHPEGRHASAKSGPLSIWLFPVCARIVF
jgi:hypothetical protein